MREALAETGGSTAQPLPRGAVEAGGGAFSISLSCPAAKSAHHQVLFHPLLIMIQHIAERA